MEKMTPKSEDIYDARTTQRFYETMGKDVEADGHNIESDKYLNSLIPENLEGEIVLDHGCGNGRYAELFLQRGAKKVIGVDLSPEMIREAIERKKEKQLAQLELIRGDIASLPTGQEKFDFIFSRFSLHNSHNLEKIMKDMSDSLKKNGEILIETNVFTIRDHREKIQNTFVPLNIQFGKSSVPLKNIVIEINQYLDAFRKAGLKIKSKKDFPSVATIDDSYEYKDSINFEAYVFELIKEDK